ncbi:unnamed protein product [Brassica oleracea var. botrytis]|uniref:ATP synthase subunit epsilon, mitochondrial n=2 Tax=Brassica TaxID=3705 RepID=A0A816QEF2_BRANA|nr:unnamed protein product [Brassica napus]VDD62249.1 unnamed protein product [Brassica oleracea]
MSIKYTAHESQGFLNKNRTAELKEETGTELEESKGVTIIIADGFYSTCQLSTSSSSQSPRLDRSNSEMASTAAAVPFWRAVGMTYITYSNICANRVRNCLKEPFKAESMSSEKVHFSLSRWADGKPHKPGSWHELFITALELYSGSLPPRRSHGKLSTLCRYHFL